MIEKFSFYGFDLNNSMSLRSLHRRLGEMLAENPTLADRPVVLAVEQATTGTGRIREDAYFPIHFGASGNYGMRGIQVVQLICKSSQAMKDSDRAPKQLAKKSWKP